MADKIFIGRVDVQTVQGNNGEWEKIKIALGPKDFELLEEHKNEKGWVNLLFQKSKGGKNYIEVDTWVPVKKEDHNPGVGSSLPPGDDLPF